MRPTKELKSLFQELVNITTKDTGRRDWALIKWKSIAPFNQFRLIDLVKH
jgi:hypothetical protein